MKCENKEIPSYLHWDERTTYKDEDFYYFHKLYRLKSQGNPIDVPAKWLTAISCKWSKLVKAKHILFQADEKKNYDDFDYVFVKEVRNYSRRSTLPDEHEFNGIHLLTCILCHSPLPCDYSHAEILIRHRVYKDGATEPFFDEVYSYESWVDKTAMLKRMQSKFFKDLKSDFRVDMIRLISRDSSSNHILSDLRAVCNVAN